MARSDQQWQEVIGVALTNQLTAALDLAAKGYRIVPLRGRKQTLKNGAIREPGTPHISNFPDEATTDPKKIRQWWRQFSEAVPGLVTGDATGVYVLDGDQKDGKDALAELRGLGFEPDDLSPGRVRTHSGGNHWLFRANGSGLRNSQSDPAPGLDWRGHNGYVRAPGAVTDKGRFEAVGELPNINDLPPPPEALLPIGRSLAERSDWEGGDELAAIRSGEDFHGATFSYAMRAALSGKTEARTAHELTVAYMESEVRGEERWKSRFNELCRIVSDARNTDAARERAEERKPIDVERAFNDGDVAPGTVIYADVEAWQIARTQHELVCEKRHPDPGPRPTLSLPASSWANTSAPPRQWHLKNWIADKAVNLIYGPAGDGKSLLAAQYAVCSVTGTDFLGLGTPKHGPALYLSAEDDSDEIHRRTEAICEGVKVGMGDLSDFHVGDISERESTLLATRNREGKIVPTELFDKLEAEVSRIKPAVIILDTAGNLFGGNEKDKAEVMQFMGLIRGRVAKQHNCAVILLAHPSRAGMARGDGTSGNVAWEAAARTRLYFTRPENDQDGDARTLSRWKSNYSGKDSGITVFWHKWHFVAEVSGYESPEDRADRVFLAELAAGTAQGRHYNLNPGNGYAPALIALTEEGEKVGKRGLAKAMARLLASREIETYRRGQTNKPTTSVRVVNLV